MVQVSVHPWQNLNQIDKICDVMSWASGSKQSLNLQCLSKHISKLFKTSKAKSQANDWHLQKTVPFFQLNCIALGIYFAKTLPHLPHCSDGIDNVAIFQAKSMILT